MSENCYRQRGGEPRRRVLSRYSESAFVRLCHPSTRRVLTLAVALGLGLSAGGCSTTYQLGNLAAKNKADDRAERTASVTPVAAPAPASAEAPAETDLNFAKAAAVDLLTRGSKDSSQPWENPRTGARGAVTPIASAYAHDGTTCRDFLASYVQGEKQSWFQGGACRSGAKWVVREIRPLQRT